MSKAEMGRDAQSLESRTPSSQIAARFLEDPSRNDSADED